MRTAAMDGSGARLRTLTPAKQPRNPISRKQVERVLSTSVAGFGFVFCAQAAQPLISQAGEAQPIWLWVTVGAILASLIGTLVASIVGTFVHGAHGLFSLVYLLALVTWPFAVVDPARVTNDNHWLYYLLTVATATAAIAFSKNLATVYLLVVPLVYGFIRTTPNGGGATLSQATLDAIYAIILGGVVMIIATMLRQAATSVDAAQATALDRYGYAVRQHATEVERVQVDAIVHDSVLTTLLSAARAYTPDAKALAAIMAGNAIEHLHEAALVPPDDGTTVRLRDVAVRIRDAAGTMSTPFELRMRDIGPRAMPVQAGEAVYSAAMQAMVNSLQHAGTAPGTRRWLTMRGVGLGGIQVEVGDSGTGFLLVAVPIERLGVRVSIIERVANAGGYAGIVSAPDKGTVVTIRWPFVEPSSGSGSIGGVGSGNAGSSPAGAGSAGSGSAGAAGGGSAGGGSAGGGSAGTGSSGAPGSSATSGPSNRGVTR
jgi:signal transduction histidine kinase